MVTAATGGPLRLTAPEAAVAARLALVAGPVAPRSLPVSEAIGRVLAEPLVAPTAVPAMPTAVRDGSAVAAADTLGAGPYAPVPPSMASIRVAPGDPLPPGTDAVLPIFGMMAEGPFTQALQPVAAGDGPQAPARLNRRHHSRTA